MCDVTAVQNTSVISHQASVPVDACEAAEQANSQARITSVISRLKIATSAGDVLLMMGDLHASLMQDRTLSDDVEMELFTAVMNVARRTIPSGKCPLTDRQADVLYGCYLVLSDVAKITPQLYRLVANTDVARMTIALQLETNEPELTAKCIQLLDALISNAACSDAILPVSDALANRVIVALYQASANATESCMKDECGRCAHTLQKQASAIHFLRQAQLNDDDGGDLLYNVMHMCIDLAGSQCRSDDIRHRLLDLLLDVADNYGDWFASAMREYDYLPSLLPHILSDNALVRRKALFVFGNLCLASVDDPRTLYDLFLPHVPYLFHKSVRTWSQVMWILQNIIAEPGEFRCLLDYDVVPYIVAGLKCDIDAVVFDTLPLVVNLALTTATQAEFDVIFGDKYGLTSALVQLMPRVTNTDPSCRQMTSLMCASYRSIVDAIDSAVSDDGAGCAQFNVIEMFHSELAKDVYQGDAVTDIELCPHLESLRQAVNRVMSQLV